MSRSEEFAAPARGRTGLMIIRAWVEEGSSEPLRARISMTNDVADGIENTVTLSRTEAVGETVLEWLDQVLAGTTTPDQ